MLPDDPTELMEPDIEARFFDANRAEMATSSELLGTLMLIYHELQRAKTGEDVGKMISLLLAAKGAGVLDTYYISCYLSYRAEGRLRHNDEKVSVFVHLAEDVDANLADLYVRIGDFAFSLRRLGMEDALAIVVMHNGRRRAQVVPLNVYLHSLAIYNLLLDAFGELLEYLSLDDCYAYGDCST